MEHLAALLQETDKLLQETETVPRREQKNAALCSPSSTPSLGPLVLQEEWQLKQMLLKSRVSWDLLQRLSQKSLSKTQQQESQKESQKGSQREEVHETPQV